MATVVRLGPCEICKVETKIHCSLCAGTFYCSKEHQKQHWKIHKKTCPGKKKTTSEPKSQTAGISDKLKLPPPDAWAVGLSGKSRYEWFIDSYRLRLDDDYVWGGCNLHGLYAEDSTPWSIMIDFLVYCKFAVKNDVIPSPAWNWNELLIIAKGQLNYAFEKSDASEKYGGENVFTGMMGGRSLRHTSGQVYGFLHGSQDHAASLVVEEMETTVITQMKKGKTSEAQNEHYFNDVGGCDIWCKLTKQLKQN